MKKIFALALAATLAMGAYADNVKYLKFRTTDGTEKSLPIAGGITITFADGEIIAMAGDEMFVANIADMISMWFDVTPTSIDTFLADDIADGTTVRVYSMEGRLVSTYRHTTGATPDLPAGTYVINAGKKVAKVLVK